MADRGVSDLLSTASSLLNSSQSHSSNASHGAGHAPKPSSSEQGNTKPSFSSHSPKPSYGEVLSSAQVVMNAAKTKLHKPSSGSSSSEDVHMGKLAGAAGTLVGAVSHYAKLDEKTGYGKYAHKAQEYLHSYEIKHSIPAGTTAPAAPPQATAYYAASEQHGNGHGHSTYTSASAASYSQQPSAPPQGYSSGYSAASYSQQPSAPPQGYSAGYPPAGYPDAQQSYGSGHQGYSTHSYANANSEPPIGYPPAGYPTSGGGYKYSSK